MKKTTVIILLILGGATQGMRAAIFAGPITNPANGHRYYLLTNTNALSSEQQAKSLGGHLATIDDADEQLWVYSTFAAAGGIYHALLIGLNDRQTEGTFRWASGAPVVFTKWLAGEPNGSTNENTVHMWAPNQGGLASYWNDIGDRETAVGSGPTFATLNGVVEIDLIQMHIKRQGSQVAVSWNSVLEINYQVQFVATPAATNWTNLGVPVLGTGSNNTVLNTTLDQPMKYYRVLSVP